MKCAESQYLSMTPLNTLTYSGSLKTIRAFLRFSLNSSNDIIFLAGFPAYTELPSIFPNLLCNPNNGIGVAIACSWAPHNLIEVAQAINDRIAGKNDIYLAADFPTGGTIINAKDIPTISKTGHGTLKLRGNYIIENNNIVFTELPYGTKTEEIMTEIGKLSDTGEILGITNVKAKKQI